MRKLLGLLVILLSPLAYGQFGRYQNCALKNAQGQAISGAQVYFLTQPANTITLTPLATIYGNATGAGGAITNPVLTNGYGECTIYAAPGNYTAVFVSPFTGTLIYPDQLIATTGGAVFTPTGIQYADTTTTAHIATIPEIQTQGGLGVHTNAYLNPNSGTFLWSPLSCANVTWPSSGCIDATSAIQAAQAAAKLTGARVVSDAAPPGYGVFITQIKAFSGEGGIVCDGRHYEQGCPWYQIPGSNVDMLVPDPGLTSQSYIDYYLIDGMAFYGDFTYTSTLGNCITFGPLRVGERTEVNRTTCNNWPNNGFNVNGGSDPLFFTDTEASGNGFGTGGGFGWNFVNTGGNTFDMVTLNGWSADNNFSGAINVKGTSNFYCVTCADTFIFRSGKMESRFDNLHIPNGQPIGINLDTTSGTPIIIDGLSALSVTPGGPGFAISTAVRGGGTIVVTTPTPHVPAVVGSNALIASNSQGAFNVVLPIVASTQTTTTLTQAGGSLTGTGGSIYFDVVTDSLVKITGNSANVKLNGVTMAGGLDYILGSPFGWYNIIHDTVNGFENNITSVPNHSSANGGSWTTAQYTYPNFCADFQCTPQGAANINGVLNAAAYCNTIGTLDQSCLQNAAAVAATTGQTIFVPGGTYSGSTSTLSQSNLNIILDPAANLNYSLVIQGSGYYRSNTVSVAGAISASTSTFSGNFSAYSPGQIVAVEQVTNNGTVPVDFLVVNTASGTTLTTTTGTRFAYNTPNISIVTKTAKFTGTIPANTFTITGNFTAQFVAGDMIRIENTTGTDNPGGGSNYFEYARVASINTSAITLETSIHSSFTNPWLAGVSFINNVSIEGHGTINTLSLVNMRNCYIDGFSSTLFITEYLYDCSLSNLKGITTDPSAFFLTFMWNSTVNNIIAYGAQSTTDNGNIKFLGVQNLAASNISTWQGTDASQGTYPLMYDTNFTPYTIWNANDTLASASAGSSNGNGGASIFIGGMRNSSFSAITNNANVTLLANSQLHIDNLTTTGQLLLQSGDSYNINNFISDVIIIGQSTPVSNSQFSNFTLLGQNSAAGTGISVLGGSNDRFLHGEFLQNNYWFYTINAQATSNNMYYEDLQDYTGTNLLFSLHTNGTGSHTLVGNRFASNVQGPFNNLNVPALIINNLGGSGHALACLDANGVVYRGTSTTCP